MTDVAAGRTDNLPPRTRGQVAHRFGLDLGSGLLGWLAGAAILVALGRGSMPDDVGAGVLAIVAFFGIAIGLPTIVARHRPEFRPRQAAFDVRWGLYSLLGCFTLPAMLRASDVTAVLTPLQLWAGLLALVLFAMTAEYVPGLIRPNGLKIAVPESWQRRGLTIIIVLVFGGLAAWYADHALVTTAHVRTITCDPSVPAEVCLAFQPTLPLLPTATWALIAGVGLTAIGSWWFRLGITFYWLIGALYVGMVLWSETVWMQQRQGLLSFDGVPGPLLVLQITAGVLLLISLPVASLFDRPRRRPTPARDVGWPSEVTAIEPGLKGAVPRLRWP